MKPGNQPNGMVPNPEDFRIAGSPRDEFFFLGLFA